MNFSHARQQVGPRLSRSMEDLDSILDRLKITLPSTPETRSTHASQDPILKPIGDKPRKGVQKVAQIPRTLKSVPSYGSLGNHDATTIQQHSKSRPIYYAKKSDLVTGETYFVDLIRGLKWLQHQDNRGAYYYFCEDDQKCLWELPILDGLLIAKGQVMYGKQEEQWCSRRIIVVEKNRSNLHILRTNFRCETAVSREISLNILDTPTQWTRTSSHILNLRICRSTSSSTSLDINIKFDARADLVEWLSQLKLDFCHNLEEAQKTSQTHPTQVLKPVTTSQLNRHHHLSRSFRRMADKVKLRDKNSSFLSGARIIRALSQRRASTIAGTLQTRDSPEELMQKGIIKPEPIFGNILNQLPFDEKVGVPEFIVRSVRKVETMMNTEGLYRIPGNAAEVQKLRMAINGNNYDMLEKTKDVTLVASTLKLFFRELPQPIISETLKNKLYAECYGPNKDQAGGRLKQIVQAHTNPMEHSVLAYLFRHLSKVAAEPSNKMTISNLATCFGQTLIVPSNKTQEPRRPESMLMQMDENNAVIELCINHVHQIFF